MRAFRERDLLGVDLSPACLVREFSLELNAELALELRELERELAISEASVV